VPEQNGSSAEPAGCLLESTVTGGAGCSLRPAGVFDDHRRNLDGVQAKVAQRHRERRGSLGGARLQLVVDGDRARPQAGSRRFERRRRGEGHRIGAAAARHEQEVAGFEVADGGAYSRAYSSNCRCRTHP